ncbi:MAG: hypothetical protein LBR31_03160 [Desulfovibrio sp.]|nr:hypothetical protein [Desulfovibrio sp.]
MHRLIPLAFLAAFMTCAAEARCEETIGQADADVFVAAQRRDADDDPQSSYIRARAIAWLKAVDRAAEALSARQDIRLVVPDIEDRRALAAQIYALCAQPPRAEGDLPHVVVILQPRMSLAEDTAFALRRPQLLRLWRVVMEEVRSADKETDVLKGLWLVREAIAPTPEGMLVSATSLSALSEAVRLAPRSSAARLALAEAQLQQGLTEQCALSCDAVLALRPDLPRARYVRALALMALGRLALAEDDVNALMASEQHADGPEMASLLHARGTIRLLRGRHDGMCEDYTAACGLGDCDGLSEARVKGYCKNAAVSP